MRIYYAVYNEPGVTKKYSLTHLAIMEYRATPYNERFKVAALRKQLKKVDPDENLCTRKY